MTLNHRPPRRGAAFALLALVASLGPVVAAPLRAADDVAPAAPPAAAGPSRRGPLAPFGTKRGPVTRPALAPKTDDFVRFVEDGRGGGRLEAAIVHYRNADGVNVHLVSALHVGEKSYYEGLTRTFKTYDALLYELIKPKGSGVPTPGVRSGGAVSGFQRFLTDVLKLEFQLDAIDYSAPNFVHADLDAETFRDLQEERGESLVTLMLKSMVTEMQRQSRGEGARPISLLDLLAAMNSPDSARQYKLLLARQFQDIESQIAGVEGEQGTVIVSERNKAALHVLEKTIDEGKRNIGVFYGAGHMAGLEDALVDEMGFKRVGIEWRVAWDMTGQPTTRPTTRPVTRPVARPAERPGTRPGTSPSPEAKGQPESASPTQR